MRIVCCILAALTGLSGCTVFSPYKTTEDYWYHHSLSKSEQGLVEQQGRLVKDWRATNKNGDLCQGQLLITQGPNGRFRFTETGLWINRYTGRAAQGWRAAVLDSTRYDANGNIVYRAQYLDENQDQVGQYLFEKWVGTRTDSLRQTVYSYYPTGQLRYEQLATVLNDTELGSDRTKRKVLRSMTGYNEAGQPISLMELQKVLYQWYQPHISMAKGE
ncbi:hypothetical protein [Hymenobacter cellulosilyticus]|uniref:Uncharacterized protein n=1 Tax=Hymenobacter cellulosilyticus TaxID=2932248 RepID=A0A8T9Q8Y3_9BACT|nr:hypothetical protein [Hymenobacter cellulosilyticus]UOQ72871.1 hypothetical protein MUN79_02460 [Hymenobacter cellulosilyticus]